MKYLKWKIIKIWKFLELKKKTKFLEHAEVFGYNYGTLRNTVLNFFEKKKDVLFDIDWQGTKQLKESKKLNYGNF